MKDKMEAQISAEHFNNIFETREEGINEPEIELKEII